MRTKLLAVCAISAAALIAKADDEGWRLHGGTQTDQRFSSLNQINEQTVSRLGLVWSKELGTSRGLEATPIVNDGLIYTTGSWSIVFALNARTGQPKWTYDPKVPRERAYFFCCDVVNRGVALHNGKIYVATLDGRLIALNQRSGLPMWTVQTTDPAKPYSITAAPRIAKDKIIIGNAGSEYGVRGYLTAYDAETGKQVWRVMRKMRIAGVALVVALAILPGTGLGGTASPTCGYAI